MTEEAGRNSFGAGAAVAVGNNTFGIAVGAGALQPGMHTNSTPRLKKTKEMYLNHQTDDYRNQGDS